MAASSGWFYRLDLTSIWPVADARLRRILYTLHSIGLDRSPMGDLSPGTVGAWICVAFILASDALLFQTAGGCLEQQVLHAFMALYGFLCDRRLYAAFASILGALFIVG
jgi:hypothetical protein